MSGPKYEGFHGQEILSFKCTCGYVDYEDTLDANPTPTEKEKTDAN